MIASGDLREADFGLWEGMTWDSRGRSGGGGRESVIVVAHGRILVFVMGYLLRRQEDKPELITKNASISVIDYDAGTGVGELLTLNDCSHLDGLAGGKRGRYC